jgi:hypothetical protein
LIKVKKKPRIIEKEAEDILLERVFGLDEKNTKMKFMRKLNV